MRCSKRLDDRLRALGSPLELALFGVLPLLTVVYTVYWVASAQVVERDFGIFRTAGDAVLHGRSPYPSIDPSVLAHFDKFVYPPISAVLFAPAAAIPLGIGQALMFAGGVASIILALRLLGVADWRCYGVAIVSTASVNSLLLGAITPLLLLGAASAWRYRARSSWAGSTAALAAVSKLFLWPLAVWLLVTRRLRALAVFLATTVLLGIGAWAAIGFAGFRSYPRLLRVLARVEEARGYGVVSLVHATGATAEALSVALSLAVVGSIVVLARGADGERRAFAAAVIGALAATPLLWLHYFVLLLVPIALYRPRLSAAWFIPLALWLTPSTQPLGSTWRICLALGVLVTVAVVTLRRQGPAVLARSPGTARSRPAQTSAVAAPTSSG
jgi:alpha-1,2-mannosyltransferase